MHTIKEKSMRDSWRLRETKETEEIEDQWRCTPVKGEERVTIRD